MKLGPYASFHFRQYICRNQPDLIISRTATKGRLGRNKFFNKTVLFTNKIIDYTQKTLK